MPIFVGNSTVNTAIANSTITVDQTKSFAYATSNRNSIRPSLILDFARSQKVDPRITFTRASSATYFNSLGVLSTAPNNVPRIDYNPATGVCNGLLIEQSSTNLITYSGDVSTFGATSSTLTANSATSPDGTTTAALMIPSVDSNNNHYINKVWNGSVGNSVTFTVSIFAKTAGYQWIRMNTGNAMGGGYLFFDIINGVVGTYGGVTNPTIQSCGNGWFRCSYQFTTAATGTGGIGHQVYAANSNNGFANWSGNGTSGYYFWGAQVEQLAFPTSYIATTSASATRVDEVASMSLGSWYNTKASSMLVEAQKNISSTDYSISLQLDDGTNNNRAEFFAGPSSTSLYFYTQYTTNITDTFVTLGSLTLSTPFKMAGAITGALSTSGTIAGSLNGATAVTGTTGNFAGSTFTTMRIGYIPTSGYYMNGWIQRISYYPTTLSNTELQTLTS